MAPRPYVVGFTGHRRLRDEALVRRRLDDVLDDLAARRGPLVVVASAAAGADTLALEAAQARGWPTHVILPFPRERFRDGFTATQWDRAATRIDAATDVTVATTGGDQEGGYLAAGLRTVERADVVLAVWDGQPPRGPAGTGAMVAYARALQKPLILIDPETGALTVTAGAASPPAAGRRLRRIVSLDGGGVFGMFSLQVLARIEAHFRRAHDDDRLVLADVVDLFAGTSTGALIATCLSWGMSVAEIERLYFEHGAALFMPESWYRRHRSKYRTAAMTAVFTRRFREPDGSVAQLGSPSLKTTLLVVMRNASTGAPWPVTNNPAALYNDQALPDCNLRIPLWQILRASTAAPTYFPPQEIELGAHRRLFVDGGISAYNNPALIAILTATLPPYRMCWPASPAELHVISIGTGSVRATLPAKRADTVTVLDQIASAVPALIAAAGVEQDLLCRVLGDCVFGAPIDSELRDLQEPTLLPRSEQKFTYARFDYDFDRSGGLTAAEAAMDNLALMPRLKDIGAAYADSAVRPEYLYPRASVTAGRP